MQYRHSFSFINLSICLVSVCTKTRSYEYFSVAVEARSMKLWTVIENGGTELDQVLYAHNTGHGYLKFNFTLSKGCKTLTSLNIGSSLLTFLTFQAFISLFKRCGGLK